MTALNASTVPLAVRVKNNRYDGLITGYLIGAPKFTKTDPGGYKAGSFVVSSRLGFRSDMIQPYSRVYFYNTRNGDTVFEGDITHPGRSTGDAGELLEVQIDGGAERLNDWNGSRIYVDRDMQAWTKTSSSVVATNIEVGDDRGGSGLDALTLAFPTDLHVEGNHRVEAIYQRFVESSQSLGRIDYTWDGGHISGSPGWLVRTIVTPPSTVVRTQILSTTPGTSSPQTVDDVAGGSIPGGASSAVLQLIWTSGASSTGTSGNDIVWVSLRGLVVVARLKMKTGSFRTTGYTNAITADQVWEDMLGDLLDDAFDGTNATVQTGTGTFIWQLAYPDGATPMQIADDLMTYEQGMTYLVGPSTPGVDKYSLKWITRSDSVRYEAMLWADEHTGGIQPADQYNEVMSRWKTPTGNIRMTLATQSIPEMDAVSRKRRYFQDLGQITGDATNAATANASVLQEHRYPKNTGRLRINREIVDLHTGRRVQPYEIEPGYMIRLVGVDPNPDALNTSLTPDGSTICRIVTTDYSGDDNSVDLDLDAVPYSMAQAIRYARHKRLPQPQRRAF